MEKEDARLCDEFLKLWNDYEFVENTNESMNTDKVQVILHNFSWKDEENEWGNSVKFIMSHPT